MGKPFADLEKRAIAILAGGGDPAQSVDTALAQYWQWRLNPSADSHNLPTASERPNGRRLNDVAINPFGIDLGSATFAKVTISQRSQSNIPADVITALQHTAITPTTAAYGLAKFKPAKVYYRTGAAESSTERTSRITGRKYKSYYTAADQGYTAPFGQNTEGDTQLERQAAIKAAIQESVENADLITFTPEKAST